MVNTPRTDGSELPKWIWVWPLPLALVVIIAGYLILEHKAYQFWIESEFGFIEIATPLVLVPAIISGIYIFRMRQILPYKLLTVWFVMVTLGCVYFVGEDLSWGQHYIGWETPDHIAEMNKQDETNLHNMSSWFNQKPRLALEMFVLIGGIFVAAWRKIKAEYFSADGLAYWFWPGFACLPAAVLAILSRAPDRIYKWYDHSFEYWLFPGNIRYSEVQELYFAFFLMIYLVSVLQRLKSLQNKK